MEPYLKRMSGSLVTQSGWCSSRKNLYQVKAPPTAPSATRTATEIRILRFHEPELPVAAMASLPSESLQVLDEGVLVRRRQLGAIGLALVPTIGIARHRRVELEECLRALDGHVRHEADLLRIVHVVPAVEQRRPLGRGLEEV